MSIEQIRAKDAEQLLANPVFQGFMKAMNEDLERKILTADVTDKERCAALVQAKKLLKRMEQVIHVYIKNGEVASLMEAEEVKRKTFAERVFKPMER